MSKALICDRCKMAFSEQNCMAIDTKWLFVSTHYDLCPICRKEFNNFMFPNKNKIDLDGKSDYVPKKEETLKDGKAD